MPLPIAAQDLRDPPADAGREDLRALMLALAGDDDRAWDAFVAHAGALMLQAAREALDSPDLIDDAVQEALLAVRDAMRRLRPTFVDPPAAAAWLRVVTGNRARNLARRESARRRWQRGAAAQATVISDTRPAGADLAALARLRRELAALPMRQREALLMRFRDDLGNRAIANRLGCSHRQVALSIHRGLHRLHQRCRAASGSTAIAEEGLPAPGPPVLGSAR